MLASSWTPACATVRSSPCTICALPPPWRSCVLRVHERAHAARRTDTLDWRSKIRFTDDLFRETNKFLNFSACACAERKAGLTACSARVAALFDDFIAQANNVQVLCCAGLPRRLLTSGRTAGCAQLTTFGVDNSQAQG